MTLSIPPETQSYAQQIIREVNTPLFGATLLQNTSFKNVYLTLAAFDCEIKRIQAQVKEPMAGEIRLKWWEEIVEGKRGEEAKAHPLAPYLLDCINHYQIDINSLHRYLRAHIFDFYHDPMPSITQLEAYAGETRGLFFQFTNHLVSQDHAQNCADASGHASVALTIAQIIGHLPQHLSQQKSYIPKDWLSLYGLEKEALFSKDFDHDQFKTCLDQLLQHAQQHEEKARQLIKKLPKNQRRFYAPFAPVRNWLQKLNKLPIETLISQPSQLPLWRHYAAMWWF